MPTPTDNPEQFAAGSPLQSGVTPEQMQKMREENLDSSVAESDKDVEETATSHRDTGGDNSSAVWSSGDGAAN